MNQSEGKSYYIEESHYFEGHYFEVLLYFGLKNPYKFVSVKYLQ